MRNLTLIVAGFFIVRSALAGGMSSGGGEVIKDAHNPWFLENTPTVTYCVTVDAATVSMDRSRVEGWVLRTIQQWTQIFADYQTNHPKNTMKIATQNWIKLSCSSGVDVQFQFGWGTLSSDQVQFLSQGGDPHRYIALAVRDDYDPVRLRAKGYVYVASDIGPNAFTKETGQIDRPWRFPTLLFAELTHELGHVFGLPHLNSELLPTSNRGVMSEYFPEVILQDWLWQGNQTELTNPTALTYFFNPTVYWDCGPQQIALDWFNAPKQTRCLKYNVNGQDGSLQSIQVQAINQQGQALAELNQISLGSTGSWESQSDITAYLGARQLVFPPPPPSGGVPYEIGPGVQSADISGDYVGSDGASKPVFVIANENSLKLIVSESYGIVPVSVGYPEPDTGSSLRNYRSLKN